MNPATQQRLTELRAEGATAEAAAAALADDPRFAQRITKDQLRDLFGRTNTGEKLQDVADNPQVEQGLRYGLRRVLRTLYYENGFVDTQDAGIAAELRAGLAALVPGVLTGAEAEALLALAGGPMLEPLTAAEITAHWAAEDAAADALALRQRAGRAYNAVVAAIDGGETRWAVLAATFEAQE